MTIISKNYEFKARDGMMITGDYTLNQKEKKKKIMLVFPGMTATPVFYLYVALRDFFVDNGWDFFIIDAYSSEQVGENFPRSLLETNMKRHVEDFEDVISHFKQKYDEVYASGHSIGGRVLIFANNKDLSGQLFLDPSGDTSRKSYEEIRNDNYKYSKKLDCKYMDWGDGVCYPIGRVFEELDCCPFSIISEKVKRLYAPSLFVAAGAVDYAKVYKNVINDRCKYIEIEGSEHDFTEYGAVKKIAENALKFFS